MPMPNAQPHPVSALCTMAQQQRCIRDPSTLITITGVRCEQGIPTKKIRAPPWLPGPGQVRQQGKAAAAAAAAGCVLLVSAATCVPRPAVTVDLMRLDFVRFATRDGALALAGPTSAIDLIWTPLCGLFVSAAGLPANFCRLAAADSEVIGRRGPAVAQTQHHAQVLTAMDTAVVHSPALLGGFQVDFEPFKWRNRAA
ncbi:uncharacterized protein CTHT_0012520 [Thermochaetoides thermophila DSM 1495]|uniref:Uncharacterized protein n=1 Tax=Chaetomium thermophilum (strain DSM 1495 / CBS 144.50 / IMI 039719) TaxID=759272 RepID=G0S167_CHATD|nr:hypothetical protein CTHT_0012520 [Thermochaetoides thermophila DSM 1495]EGS22777.1 hypothetical protein CTHT_0012520 [Thermochaetoides thermophila DSM 1495]